MLIALGLCLVAFGKASVYNVGDPGSIPGLGRSPGEGNGNPLQYYCLENPMDRGAWKATVHGVAKSRTWLSDFTFTFTLVAFKQMLVLTLNFFQVQHCSVQSSCSVVSDSATPWTTACQASLSDTNSLSLLKLMSIESVIPSNHFILCRPLLLLPSVLLPSIRVFSNESVLYIRWPKYWSFSSNCLLMITLLASRQPHKKVA